MTHVELMQLGAAAVRGREQLAARAPAQAAHRVVGHGDRALRGAAGRRKRPRLIRARALIGHDRERATVRRERERGAAREAARRVRDAREPIARMEVRERPVGTAGYVTAKRRASNSESSRALFTALSP